MTIIIDIINLMVFIKDIIRIMTHRIKTIAFSIMTCIITTLHDDIQHFN